MTTDKNIWTQILRMVRKPLVDHSLIWLVLLVIFSFYEIYFQTRAQFHLCADQLCSETRDFGAAVYYNIYVLILSTWPIKRVGRISCFYPADLDRHAY
ncbi:MAG: hypothetical protein R2788_26040 [Saprospiraceae bacterium]